MKFIVIAGRGRVGKTAQMLYLAEWARKAGIEVTPADGDYVKNDLSKFYPEARRPDSQSADDMLQFLNDLVDTQIRDKLPLVMLDMAGGDMSMRMWSRDLGLNEFLTKHKVTPILLHMLSTATGEMNYLSDLEMVFAPARTAIILNTGTVAQGKHLVKAFDPILAQPVFIEAVNRGCKVLQMPRLGCMETLINETVTFEQGMFGNGREGGTWISFTMQQMISRWVNEMDMGMKDILEWINE